MNSGSDEQNICKDLKDKYPNLKDYKTGKRFKVQKKSVEEILEIITDDNDKKIFNEFLSLYNIRKGKTNFIKKDKKENTVKEKVKKIELNNSENLDNSNILDNSNNPDNSNNLDNSDNSNNSNNSEDSINPFKKQRDNVLKKLSKLQNEYEELQEKNENLNNVHNEFKVSYKEACHERNKLELLTEKKGWTKDIREEFDKYKNFYHKYIDCVDELDKIKN